MMQFPQAISHWTAISPRGKHWLAATVLVTASACGTMNRPAELTERRPLGEGLSEAASSPGKVRMAPLRGQVTTQFGNPYSNEGRGIERISHEVSVGPVVRGSSAMLGQGPADVRLPVPADCPCPVIAENPCALSEKYPEEYLCDGGDRDYPVHYDDQRMLGLETEDTVAEYVTEDGKRRVKPSNQVCIYSPRFAAVVSVSAPIEDAGGGRPSQAITTLAGLGLRNREGTTIHNQNEGSEGMISRVRGSGLQTQVASTGVNQSTALVEHDHTAVVLENVGALPPGLMTKTDEVRLAARIQSAGVWTRDQNPVIAATTDSAGEIRGLFNVNEFIGKEDRFKRKGKLYIVKLADKKVAAPGDVITFTIRYENLGDKPLKDVVIVDNLTPRLEYVDDSATSDRDGRLVTEDNGEGSLILRWELEEPLPGRTSGTATFQARVR